MAQPRTQATTAIWNVSMSGSTVCGKNAKLGCSISPMISPPAREVGDEVAEVDADADGRRAAAQISVNTMPKTTRSVSTAECRGLGRPAAGRRDGAHAAEAVTRRRPQDVVGGQGTAVDVPEDLLVGRGTRAVVDQLPGTQPDDAVAVAPRQVEEVQVDDGRDAQLAVDALRGRA